MPLGIGSNYLVKVSLRLDDKDFNDKLVKTGQSMKKVGQWMSMYLTTSILAVGGAMAKTAMDFESSMSKIIGLVGISKEQVAEWNNEILKMAGAVGKAPKELAEALYFITSAGIKGSEAMDILEASAKAASAGLGETKTIADLLTSAMSAYGMKNLSAAKATDILVAAVREGKGEASEFAGALGKVLPIASEMGVRFDEVAAATAAMSRTGLDVNEATTALRGILSSLLSPTREAE